MNRNHEETVELAERLEVFEREYHYRQQGDDFQLLSPWIKRAALTSALETQPAGVQSLTQMLYIITSKVMKSESKCGFIGEKIEEAINCVTKEVLKRTHNAATPGQKLLIKRALIVLMIVVITTVRKLTQEKLKKENGTFIYELILQMIISGQLIEETYRALLEVSESEKGEEEAVALLTLLTLMVGIETAEQTGYNKKEMITENFIEPLKQWIEKVVQMNLAGDIGVTLQQASLRLAENDIKGFYTAIEATKEDFGLATEKWNEEFEALLNYADRLITVIEMGGIADINELTGLFQSG